MILASGSPRRRQLLEELGYRLEVLPADVDEARLDGESPVELVERLAASKARASLERARREGVRDADGLLVAADTIVWRGAEALGKPAGAAEAARMLEELSGSRHSVSTGVCALRLDEGLEVVGQARFVETTEVEFWPLSPAEIEAYVATGEPLDKAGAYGIQGLGRTLVRGIAGDYYNVVGLPVSRLVREMREL